MFSGTALISMEYFTRQITLQERLKQHECQIYPLIGSCLELRDESPEGCYQDSPMDLSHGGPSNIGQSSSYGNNEPSHTGKSSSPRNNEPSNTGKSSSPRNNEPSHTGKSSSPGNNEPSHTGKSSSPGNNEPSHTGKSSSPGNNEPSPMGKSMSPENNEQSHAAKSSSPGNNEPSHTGKSASPRNKEPSHTVESASPENTEPSHAAESSSPRNKEPPHTVESASPENTEPSHMSKFSSPGFRTSIQTHKVLPSGKQDLPLASYTRVTSNNEERSSCANEQPKLQPKHVQDTIQLSVHRNMVTDVTDPLLKTVLESEGPSVSAIFTMKDMQDQNEMLHQVKQIHESDSPLQIDSEGKQSSSTTNSDKDRVSKKCDSLIGDAHQSKHSNGLENNSEKTNGQEHKLYSYTTTENRESERFDSVAANKLPNPANANVKGLTSTTETVRKYSRKRGRLFSYGLKQAYLPIGKKPCNSQICPNVNVTDFTHQSLSDKNRRISENVKHCRKIWPGTDINMAIPWTKGKQDPMSSVGLHSNHVVMLVPSSVALVGNAPSIEQTVEHPLVVDISPKQHVPPPLLLTSGQSELGPNQKLYYPRSRSNIITQQYPPHHHQQKQQMQHAIHINSAAIASNTPVRMTVPLDLSTKAMYSKKQSSHVYNSVSEETRIKEISDSLRAQLLEQSTTVPHLCPGVCLGHAVKDKGTSKFMSSTQRKRSFRDKAIDQTSIIIERQVLLNLDYKHLLNSETSPKVNMERSSNESVTTDNDRIPTQDGQELLIVKQHSTQSVAPNTASNINHKTLTDVDQVMVQAVDLQRLPEVNHSMSTDTDRNMLPRNEQSLSAVTQDCEQLSTASVSTDLSTASVSTDVDANGSNVRASHSMAWNMSVSKTIGLHSNCNNCKACRRIFAKLSIPPIEDQLVSSKQSDLG